MRIVGLEYGVLELRLKVTRQVLGCQSCEEGSVSACGPVAFRGKRMPASRRVQEAAAHTASPGMKDPVRSRRLPTTIGEMNIANPENVRIEPQITATLSGVIPSICMGRVSSNQ